MDIHATSAPRGKRCTRCLCCDAIVVFAGEALCAACDDGTHLDLSEQRTHAQIETVSDGSGNVLEVSEVVHSYSPLTTESEDSMNRVHSAHSRGTRVSADVIAAIQREDASISNLALARKYGISDFSVGKYRRQAGIKSTAKPGKHRAAGSVTAAHTATQPRINIADDQPEPEKSLRLSRVIVNDKMLEAWWKQLSYARKTELFTGNYVIQLKGEVLCIA
jgi:transposase-like protein